MNKLPIAQRAQILAMLCEGASIRSVSRLADVSISTVSKLLVNAGKFCAGYHYAKVRMVKCKRVQVDEIWSLTGAKQKNVAAMKAPVDGAGDTWTCTAIDADTKLIVSHFVGGRDGECAKWFIDDIALRIATRIQLTSDGHKAYLGAVEAAFNADVDYAMLIKHYGNATDSAKSRYSPAECTGVKKTPIEGSPDPKHISTSYAERANLTMRMHNRSERLVGELETATAAGFTLSSQSIEAIGKAEARRARWGNAALWVIAGLLFIVVWRIV